MAAHILLIEDNVPNLDLMTYLLNAFGHTTITALNGAEGLEIARRARVDLILCDIQLPVMDGYEVARWLKSHPHLRTIPLIAVTALAMAGDRDRVLEAGFDDYITKPITPETFVSQIEAFLHGKQPREPTAFLYNPACRSPTANMKTTILVVDDTAINIALARSTFEPFGYTVLAAESIQEALVVARQEMPDLIISDVNMRDGSGYEFIMAVKADSRLQSIPFVFITSTYLNTYDQVKGVRLGAMKFLCRPIEPTILLSEISECLRK